MYSVDEAEYICQYSMYLPGLEDWDSISAKGKYVAIRSFFLSRTHSVFYPVSADSSFCRFIVMGA